MKKYLDIAYLYKPFYQGKEKYYHNFNHAIWVVLRGLEALDLMRVESSRLKEVYTHAMACHDAGHSNGLYQNDMDNVQKALEIFEKFSPLKRNSQKYEMAKIIILATAAPYENYESIEQIIISSSVQNKNRSDLRMLIELARDIDHIGIIGIRDEVKRREALIGLMREKLQIYSSSELIKIIEIGTHQFFDNLSFYTKYGIQWKIKNFTEARRWQLEFTSEAIDIAGR